MAGHSGCRQHSALPPRGFPEASWHGLSRVDHALHCVAVPILTITASTGGQLSMHQAQFQVLYRNFLSALVLEAEAQSSLPLLMMCWSLQRLSDKTKGITVSIWFATSPALLPVSTSLPTLTEIPSGASLGPVRGLWGLHQPLSPWASLRYRADWSLPALGRCTSCHQGLHRAWHGVPERSCSMSPPPCTCAHTHVHTYVHTHPHALLSLNLELYPPLPILAHPSGPPSKPHLNHLWFSFLPFLIEEVMLSSVTKHSLGA